eukprot:Nk52_evm1s401 gene=Nk52_evmTU1s401
MSKGNTKEMKSTSSCKRVAINGFGRIGRLLFRLIMESEAARNGSIEIALVNDSGKGGVVAGAHLLEFDSTQGMWKNHSFGVDADKSLFTVDGKKVQWSSSSTIEGIPLKENNVDIVLECTGKWKTEEEMKRFIAEGGVSRVIVSRPVKGVPNIVYGINDNILEGNEPVVTAASCTTNCIAPLFKVMLEKFGVEHAMLSTIHNATGTQNVVDGLHSDLRRARSGMQSLIPTSTGSATAITMIFPELTDKVDGIAIRVPLLDASLSDVTFQVSRDTTVEEVNQALQEYANTTLKGILRLESRPLVSADFVGTTESSIADAACTRVTNKRLVKLFAWYDNELGYSARMAELLYRVADSIPSN